MKSIAPSEAPASSVIGTEGEGSAQGLPAADNADNAKLIATLAKGAGTAFVGRSVGRGFSLFARVILARLLGPMDFGLYSIGWMVMMLAGTVGPLGVDSGVIFFGSRYRGNDSERLRGVILAAGGVALASGLALAVSSYLLAPWIAASIFLKPQLGPLLRAFSPGLMLVPILQTSAASGRISQRMARSVLAQDVAPATFNLLFIAGCYLIGGGLVGYVAAAVVAFGLGAVLSIFYLVKTFPQVRSISVRARPHIGELLKFSIPALFVSVLGVFIFSADRWVVAHYLSAAEVGIYQAAAQLALTFGAILGAFNMVLAPMIAELYGRRGMHEMNELFKVSTKWAVSLCVPVFVVVFLTSSEIMSALYGHAYIGGSTALVILAGGQLVNVATGPVNYVLLMSGRQRETARLSLLVLVVGLGLDVYLVPRFGLTGSAAGGAAAITMLFILMLRQTRASLGLWPYDRRYLKILFAAGVDLGLLSWLHIALAAAGYVKLPAMLLGSVLIFSAVLLLLGLDEEEFQVINMVVRKIRTSASIKSLA